MPRYKRTADEAQLDVTSVMPEVAPADVETLTKLRNMWEFASLMQYIFLFGHVVKVDEELDIEDLEAECLKTDPPSEKLPRIGLQLLKYVSSHRGLTPDIFTDYTRRQYLAKLPPHLNPFGDPLSDPTPFNDLDIFTRVQVLQQLTVWTLGNVQRIREAMPADEDHLTWRMEPLGWDRRDYAYYVLDDNRLYRRADILARAATPPPPPATKGKGKGKAKKAPAPKTKPSRASKRRKTEDVQEEEDEMDIDALPGAAEDDDTKPALLETADEESYGFTSTTWSLIAITLEEYDDFLASIFRSRDPNEKLLHKRITDDVRPIIEQREEKLRQKALKKIRELQVVEKIATAKRSSRLAGRFEREKEERDKREAEEARERELRMAHESERRIAEGHESRRMTREQRIKEREVKRILHEEELQKLREAEERGEGAEQQPGGGDLGGVEAEAERKRISSRQAKVAREQHERELAQLAAEDEEGGGVDGNKWYFDCAVCGMHGQNLDDGTHSLACDRCGVWQHSGCHGFTPRQAEGEGFTFICKSCKRLEREEAEELDGRPKIPPLKLGSKKGGSGSPVVEVKVPNYGQTNGHGESSGAADQQHVNGHGESSSRAQTASTPVNGHRDNSLPPHVQRQLDGMLESNTQPRPSPGPFGQLINGPSLSPHGQAQGPPGYRYPPVGNFAPQQPWQGSGFPPPPRPGSSAGGHAGYPGSAGSASGSPTLIPAQHTKEGYRPQQPPPRSPQANVQGERYRGPGPQPVVSQPQHQYVHHQPVAAPPPHQQQHQYAHQRAVAATGAHHPAYAVAPAYNGRPEPQNGAVPRLPATGTPLQPPPPVLGGGREQYYRLQAEFLTKQQQQQQQQGGQRQGQGFGQQSPGQGQQVLGNGFSSPVKGSAQVVNHTPHQPTHPQQQHYAPPQSSPALQPTPTMHGGPAPNLAITPQQNQHSQSPARPSSSSGKIAADGMSGPWPPGSNGIPMKHDLPPSSSPMVGSEKVMMAPGLVPSPQVVRQVHGEGVGGVIPVKRDVPPLTMGREEGKGDGEGHGAGS
ncbi:hypothetical protein LTR56_016162 [Elasticomyces elasticus]|nr:hypothetical protein LTR56_016162 [Elasticomyces elasticus]